MIISHDLKNVLHIGNMITALYILRDLYHLYDVAYCCKVLEFSFVVHKYSSTKYNYFRNGGWRLRWGDHRLDKAETPLYVANRLPTFIIYDMFQTKMVESYKYRNVYVHNVHPYHSQTCMSAMAALLFVVLQLEVTFAWLPC